MMRKMNFCDRFLSVISIVRVMITVIGGLVPARPDALRRTKEQACKEPPVFCA